MRKLLLLLVVVMLLGACASPTPEATPTPVPTSIPAPIDTPALLATPTSPALTEASFIEPIRQQIYRDLASTDHAEVAKRWGISVDAVKAIEAEGTARGWGLPTPTPLLPEYTMFKDSSYEDLGTVKVIWEVVSPGISKEDLTVLLNELYKQALVRTSGANDRPVVIDIKAYASEDYALSGQWIGWMSKIGGNTQPTIHFNERQLNAQNEQPETKFGLPEAKRKQISQDIIRVEDRARAEALQQYPDMLPYEEFRKLEDELIFEYKAKLAQKEDLTFEQLDEIVREGFDKDWPFP